MFNLENFSNSDLSVLTVLVVGTEKNVRSYIYNQHRLGVVEVSAWSKTIPVPNCPGKLMSLLNRTILDADKHDFRYAPTED
jgi:hypothetical protein